jgi:hypothetical protein
MNDFTPDLRIPTTTPTTPAAELKSQHRKGGKIFRQQLQLTEKEYEGLQATKGALMLHAGRPVTLALATRLAIYTLAAQCERSLRDPALAARLKANLFAVRKAQ